MRPWTQAINLIPVVNSSYFREMSEYSSNQSTRAEVDTDKDSIPTII